MSEAELLENVELKIALTPDDKLDKILDTFLVPILIKLDSVPVRAKVMSICSHINKRVRGTAIGLPVAKLVVLLNGAHSALVKSFALIYVEMGFTSLSQKDALEVAPQLVIGLASRGIPQQMILFQLFLKMMGPLNALPELEQSNDTFGFDKHPQDLKTLLDRFADVLLYFPTKGTGMAPGLSSLSAKFITNDGKATWTNSSDTVKALKISIAKFVMNPFFVPKDLYVTEKYLIYVVCSADVYHEVQSIGLDGARRNAKPSFEDEFLVQFLYRLYLGSQETNPDETRSPGSVLMKQKILEILSKSQYATNCLPFCMSTAIDAIYGEGTVPKLRAAGMGYVQWIARMASTETMIQIAPELLAGVVKFINTFDRNASNDNDLLLGFAYESLGSISKRVPALIRQDTSLLTMLFDALIQERPTVRMSVVDTLFAMVPAYQPLIQIDSSREFLQELILKNLDQEEHQARYVAVRYAVQLFPFSSVFARYVCLIALSDSKIETVEEAKKGLAFPERPSILGNEKEDDASCFEWTKSIPDLAQMTHFLKDMETRPRAQLMNVHPSQKIGSYTFVEFSHLLEFLRQLFVLHAYPRAIVDPLGVDGEDDKAVTSVLYRTRAKALILDLWNRRDAFLEQYVGFMESALTFENADGTLLLVASRLLVDLLSLSPDALNQTFESKLVWIKAFLKSPKIETRQSMAHVVGILGSAGLADPEKSLRFDEFLGQMIQVSSDTSKGSLDARHGAILVSGFLIGRYLYRSGGVTPPEKLDLFSKATESIATALKSDLPIICLAGFQAFAEMGRYALLPLDESKPWPTRQAIVESCISAIKSAKEPKFKEHAILALSHLAMSSAELRPLVLEFFFTLPMMLSKNIEIHFTVGEAFAALLFGFGGSHMDRYLDIADVTFPILYDLQFADEAMSKMMEVIRPESSTSSRKAGCVWLLCLIRYAGHLPALQSRIVYLQKAFSSLLSDRDDFTQEVASKGIGLVYELGDPSIKNDLVRGLVSTFTEGKKLEPQSLSPDTMLFDGSIGTAPDGSNVTSYQSILSLAADMNQPELVYKFMSLASHHAIWNSKRGASMGFGSIAAQAEEQLKPHLPTLIPKLYRYRFDPNPKVADSMKNIWGSLVKDSKKTVDAYFDVILKDVLVSLSDRMWRVREASCLAVTDILIGRHMSEVEPYLQELWTMSFRVLDDIKESVRQAAFVTCKTLIQFTVRFCDPENAGRKQGKQVIETMMPFLVQKGLFSVVEEVRKFSLVTILELCKKGGVLLKPHLATLADVLLESMSSLEPQFLNYLTFHAEKYSLTSDQLDSSRLAAAGSSPIMEAVEACIQQMDRDVLESFVPNLCTLIRKGIGLPTRAGCARAIYFLVLRIPQDLKLYADTILQALSGAIQDRNPVVKRAFMSAAGHVSKLCSHESLIRFIRHVKKGAFEEESGAGSVFLDMSRYSSERFKDYLGDVLPLAYIGSYDPTESIAKNWQDLWDENTAGASGAAKLWSKEIMSLCQEVLTESPSWPVKKQIGKALGNLATLLKEYFVEHMHIAVPLLVESLSGRTWEGKESVLEALCIAVVQGKEWFQGSGADQIPKIQQVFIRESKKTSNVYRRVSIECLGKVFDALELDAFGELEEYLKTVSEEELEDAKDKPLGLLIQANAYKTLALVFPFELESQGAFAVRTGSFLSKSLPGKVWNVQLSILNALEIFFKKTRKWTKVSPESKELLSLIITNLLLTSADPKYSAIREKAVAVLMIIVETPQGRASVQTDHVLAIQELITKEPVTTICESLKQLKTLVSSMEM